ncbi:zinc finger protein ZAT5 [Senna tora]|uniref:Zinc finger protein ZAT5 n=1 Tax=Senna tora TaxID=362788 RepID=A0A834SN77_9FABA|nr:zinc finger protein ZAT5 [Senna tora]
MDMEGTEEVVGSTHVVAKGKRTKRHRPFPSSTLANSTSSSASADDHVSSNSSTTYEEDQDMANCLILLAQGAADPPPTMDLYECKTCNRTFPSFQALGGHRASHKKPKLDDKKPPSPSPPPQVEDAGEAQFKITPPISLQLPTHNINKPSPTPTNKAKIHECSICGSEFTSGQALGGHMRRHRASTTTNAAPLQVKPRNVLELDLNLPAPEDDLRDSKFQFTPSHKPLVLSAPALLLFKLEYFE